jgi:hypothetical protein
MATYKPSFVDISGLSQGLTRGLEIAAERKRQADASEEAKVNEFLKMYQQGKLREQDIPDFTSAYNNYKQSALNFSKLNRGGGKPEELAVAKANMDKSLGQLNSIYSNSAMAADRMAEYAESIKYARNKGLSIPAGMSSIYDNLSRTSIGKLDMNNIPSPSNFNLMSEDIDYAKLFKDLDLVGAKAKQSKQFVDNPNSGYQFMGKPLSARTIVTTETRNPVAMAKALRNITADPTHNGVKLQMNRQFNILKNSDSETKNQVVESLKPIFNVNSIDEITPEMLFAYNLSTPSIVKQEDDPKFVDMQIKEIETQNRNRQNALNRAVSLTKGGSTKMDVDVPSHPYNAITKIKEEAGTGIPVDASRVMQSYVLPGQFGGKETITNAVYNPKTDNFDITTFNGKKLTLSPEALEAQIVETSGEYKARTVKKAPASGPTKPSKSKGIGSLGLDLPIGK